MAVVAVEAPRLQHAAGIPVFAWPPDVVHDFVPPVLDNRLAEAPGDVAERLKADFQTEPAAAGRVARIRAALGGKWELTAAGPELPLGDGKRLKLQREGEALKVVGLE